MTGLFLMLAALMAPAGASPWAGTWTFDVCHEDRKADHDNDTFCREGRDRVIIAVDPAGAWDITLCPNDPWGERNLAIEPGGRQLSFRTRDYMDVKLTLGEDRGHFRGSFRTPGGHSGRIWGRRVAGCG
jgi:hypothetical protein